MTLVRGEFTSGTSNSQNNSAYGLPNIPSTGIPGTISGFSTGVNEWRSMYYTGSAHYAFKGKYIVDVTARLDATTKFGPARRWGLFPAISFRWNVSDEAFMDAIPWVSMLSIRPSLGLVGNQPGSEYLYFSRYASGPSYNDGPSIYPSNIVSITSNGEEWRMERGFRLRTVQRQMFGDVTVLQLKTTELLMGGRGIPFLGYSSLATAFPLGMENKGWELYLQTTRS
jgi:hypothetical protein